MEMMAFTIIVSIMKVTKSKNAEEEDLIIAYDQTYYHVC